MVEYSDQGVRVLPAIIERAHTVIAEVVETVVETQQITFDPAGQSDFNFTSEEFGGHMGN